MNNNIPTEDELLKELKQISARKRDEMLKELKDKDYRKRYYERRKERARTVQQYIKEHPEEIAHLKAEHPELSNL